MSSGSGDQGTPLWGVTGLGLKCLIVPIVRDLTLQRPVFSAVFHQPEAGRVGSEGSLSHFAPAPRELPGHPEALLQVPRVTVCCRYSHYRQLSIQAVLLLLYGQGGVISFKPVISCHSLGASKAWASEQRDSEGHAAEPGSVWGGFAPDACGWQIRAPGDTGGCDPCAASGCWSGRRSVSPHNNISLHVSPGGKAPC